MVERICCLGTEAELDFLGDAEVTRQCKVYCSVSRACQKVARRISFYDDTGNRSISRKGSDIKPHSRRGIIDIWITDQTSAVGRNAVMVGVGCIQNSEWSSASDLYDRRDAPAVEDVTKNSVTAFIKIGLKIHIHIKNMRLVGVRAAFFEIEQCWVL